MVVFELCIQYFLVTFSQLCNFSKKIKSVLIWLTKEGCLLETWCNDNVTLPYPLITKCIASFYVSKFSKMCLTWHAAHNNFHMAAPEWVWTQRRAPLFFQPIRWREGWGQNIFSHMRHLSSHLCVQLWRWIYFIAS